MGLGDEYQTIILSAVATKSQRAKARFKITDAKGNVHFPINDCSDVSDAWGLRHNTSLDQGKVEAHIRKAAKALGCKVPMTQEAPNVLQTFLTLETADVPGLTILLEASASEGGRMKMKVPFYRGGSITRAPGFDKKIHFPAGLTQEIVDGMNTVIAQGRQPLTVYARHSHAMDGRHLPVGAVVGAERDGDVGYAVIELEPTDGEAGGKNLMTLLRSRPPKVNAVSLRSGVGGYQLNLQKVNGEPIFVCQKLEVAGIDFAPDGPAMDTYGFEVLAAEASIEPYEITSEEEQKTVEITLEAVRENPEIVQAIERPLRDEISKVAKERDDLKSERDAMVAERDKLVQEKADAEAKAEKDAYVEKVCAKLTQEQATALREFAGTVKTKAELAATVSELLLEAPAAPTQKELTPLEKLTKSFFPNSGNSTTERQEIVQETSTDVEENLP